MSLIDNIKRELLQEVKDLHDLDYRFYEIVEAFQVCKIKELKNLMDYLYSDFLYEEAEIYILRKNQKKVTKKIENAR